MSDNSAADSTDIIDFLAGIRPGERVADLRRHRSQARTNAQHSFRVLLEAGDGDDGGFTGTERYVVAAFVAGLHQGRGAAFYADLLGDVADGAEGDAVVNAVAEAVEAGLTVGPYGAYREPDLGDESVGGPEFTVDPRVRGVLGEKLAAALEFAHLLVFHPRDCRPERLAPLAWWGWTPRQVVSLAQLISFLCFQLRAAAGLAALKVADAMYWPLADGPVRRPGTAQEPGEFPPLSGGAFDVLTYPDLHRPTRFVSHGLGWRPWVPPVEEKDLTDRQLAALVDPVRAKSAYFRLLAHDPDALEARTLTDKDIFYNVTDGAGRAEREISAAVTSRYNGCVYCASVHTGRALQESTGREDDVRRLCDDGVDADLGSETWNAIAEASVALTSTPVSFSADHVHRLRAAGLDDGSVVDVVNGAAFFNWANRLMLSLGEPELPARFR